MKFKNLWIIAIVISSLLLLTTFSAEAADRTITDGVEDVTSMDMISGETIVVTSSPYIDVDNIDLTQATYTQQGGIVTLALQVRGDIEDRGQMMDLSEADIGFESMDVVEYRFELTTSDQMYSVTYTNKTCQLDKGDGNMINISSSDFSVTGDTLTASFQLDAATETYDNLTAGTTYINADFTNVENISGFVLYSDFAPNPTLTIYEAYGPNIGSIGESIQFNGSATPFTGQPPYTYDWNFGDQGTATVQNPTHTYSKAGEFTYTFTVTDHAGATASETGTITISSGGSPSSSTSTPMILFLAILAIVIIVGVIVIVWIVRR
jgi:hypothetical protein